MPVKIGILLPKSLIYPAISIDFMNGLRMACQENEDIQLIPETIDFAAKSDIIVEKTQKLLFQDQFSALICLGGRTLKETHRWDS